MKFKTAQSRDALVETFNTLRRKKIWANNKSRENKIQYMRNTRKEIKRQDIVIDNMTFEHASFKYLGSIVKDK